MIVQDSKETIENYILQTLSSSNIEPNPNLRKTLFKFYADILTIFNDTEVADEADSLKNAIEQLREVFQNYPLAWSLFVRASEIKNKRLAPDESLRQKATMNEDTLREIIIASMCPEEWYLTISHPDVTRINLGQEHSVKYSLSRERISENSMTVRLPKGDVFSISFGYSPGDFTVERPREIFSKHDLIPLNKVDNSFIFKPTRRGYSIYSIRIEDRKGFVFLQQEFKKTIPISPIRSLVSSHSLGQADLILEIDQHGDLLQFKIWLPQYNNEARVIQSPEPLSIRGESFLDELKRTFDKLAKTGKRLPPDTTRRELEEFGMLLYEQLIPKEFKDFYWSQIVNLDIKSAIIISNLLDVPWEMIRPVQGSQELPFLCEQYELTRWLPNYTLPSLDLRIFPLALVANDGGLKGVQQEHRFLIESFSRPVEKIGANWDAVQQLLRSPEMNGCCGLHIAGHGTGSEFRLTSNDKISPKTIGGKTSTFSGVQPFVFLNFCKAADIPNLILTKIDSWTTRFIAEGKAQCVIGPMWAANDTAAALFSQTLYTQLSGLNQEKEPLSLGKAVQRARSAISDYGDATWLSYAVYGHPLAKLP